MGTLISKGTNRNTHHGIGQLIFQKELIGTLISKRNTHLDIEGDFTHFIERKMDCLDRSQMRATWISTIFVSDEYSSKKKPFGLTFLYLLGGQVPRSCFCFLLRNGTLIIYIPWIIEGPWIPRGRLFALFIK